MAVQTCALVSRVLVRLAKPATAYHPVQVIGLCFVTGMRLEEFSLVESCMSWQLLFLFSKQVALAHSVQLFAGGGRASHPVLMSSAASSRLGLWQALA